tara:strand:- start:184 stop:720 length:537 start_codon:yes stop_codon:yes gene_type:complete
MAITRLNNNSVSSVTSLSSLSSLPNTVSAKGILSMNTTTLSSEHTNTTADYADALALTFTPTSATSKVLVLVHAQYEARRDSGDQIKGAIEMTHNIGGSQTNFTGNWQSNSGFRFFVRYISGTNNVIGGIYSVSHVIDLETESYSSGSITLRMRHKRTDVGGSFVKPDARITALEFKD